MTKARATIKSHSGHILWEGEAEMEDIENVTLTGPPLPDLHGRKDWDLYLDPYHSAFAA